MKKILYSIISITIVLLVIICLGKIYSQDNEVLMDRHIPKKSGSTSISMMYETEAGSGIYQETADSSFSPDGYTFNERLSKCENGSILEYDKSTGKVMMHANKSDRCYVYFDVLNIKIVSATFETDNMCSSRTGLKNVEFDSECNVSKYYLSTDGINYQEVPLENPVNNCSGTLLWCNNQTYNFWLYAILEDGTQIETYESSYTVPTCFVAGTKVYTEKGYQNIEDIKVGDQVYSYNEDNKKIELNKVSKLYVHEDNKIYSIKVGNEIINVTPYHIVYAKTKYDIKGKWIAVKDLTDQHYLYTAYQKFEKIKSIDYKIEYNTVYNLEVENNHTYFITNSNYLVHNNKAPACHSDIPEVPIEKP